MAAVTDILWQGMHFRLEISGTRRASITAAVVIELRRGTHVLAHMLLGLHFSCLSTPGGTVGHFRCGLRTLVVTGR